MLIQRVNRTDPEKAFIVVKNAEASVALVQGGPVVFKASGTGDGSEVVKLITGAAAKAPLLAGVADSAIANAAYGLVQCYGVRTDAVINQAGTASGANGAIGDVLTLWTASDAFSGAAAGAATGYSPWAVLMQTVASSATVATTTGTIFLRCM